MFSFNPFHTFSRTSQQDQSLQELIDSEKKLVSKWIMLADDRRIAADNLTIYGAPLGDDLTDVTSKMGNLLSQWSKILSDFAGNCDQYQLTLKSIAERESGLHPSREKKRRLEEQIQKLTADNQPDEEGTKLNDLKQQLNVLKEATATDEREMDNFKRIAVREAFYLLLNGMHEMASKTDVLSSFGKYIVDELDVTPVKDGDERQPYKSSEQTHRILNDATYAIENWKPDGTKVRRTLTSHHGRNPLVTKEKALPPSPVQPTKLIDDAETTDNDNSNDNNNDTDNDNDNDTEINDQENNNNNTIETNDQEHENNSNAISPSQQQKNSPGKQESFYSLHKPDAVDEANYEGVDDTIPPLPSSPRFQPATIHSPNISSTHPDHTGGFSTVYLGLPDHQKLYQFYTNYTPPKSYEEMQHILSPQAVFHPSPTLSNNSRIDVGGFVLPGSSPSNFLVPQPSISASSVNSLKSNGSTSHPHPPHQNNNSNNNSTVPSPIPSPSTSSSSPPPSKIGSKVSMLRSKFQKDE
ncbi:unnamed protein product [Cunninghamella echinulata]